MYTFFISLLIAFMHAVQNSQTFERRCGIEIEAEGVCSDEKAR